MQPVHVLSVVISEVFWFLPRVYLSGLPPALEANLSGYVIEPVTIGESRASVFRLSAPSRETLILKTQRRELLHGLYGEAERLRWLRNRAPVPEVVDFVANQSHDYLLMQALPGGDAATVKLDPDRLVTILAEGLRELHAVDISDCPFRHTAGDLITRAESYLREGAVDESNLDPENMGRPPADIFAEMVAVRPKAEELVFTHGDFCLPNVIVHDGRLGGFVDLGTSGIGDLYRDLALVGRSLHRNLGPDWL